MKINMPRILGATLTIIFLLGLAQTAQPAKETGTVTLKEPTAVNRVYLLNGDSISGTVISLDKDALFLDCMLSKKLRIDMRAVIAVYFQPKTQESFQPRKEEMDKIEFVNGDKITGDVLSLSGKTITIKGEYGELILKKEGLSHIIFGLREKIDLGFPKEEKNVVILKLVNGDTVSGKLLNFSDDVFHFTAKYSQELKIKSQYVSSLTFTCWPKAGTAWKRNGKDNAAMVLIPAGEFLMGSPQSEGASNEHPQHKIFLDAYYIDQYEVTVSQYRAFCQATNRKMPSVPSWGWQDNHPIVNVSWYAAAAYANYYGKRLPTEAEWEKAARGGSTTKYCFGDTETDLKEYAWYNLNSNGQAHPVGTKKPNAFGLYDMYGNIWEWCGDWYDENYYARSPAHNPQGPSGGQKSLERGGGWENSADYCCSTMRDWFNPTLWFSNGGFRCVSSP